MLYETEIGDRLAEGFAHLSVLHRQTDRTLDLLVGRRSYIHSTHIERVESDVMAFADLAQNILHRHLNIVEEYRPCGRTGKPHLLLFRAERDSGTIGFDDEHREL